MAVKSLPITASPRSSHLARQISSQHSGFWNWLWLGRLGLFLIFLFLWSESHFSTLHISYLLVLLFYLIALLSPLIRDFFPRISQFLLLLLLCIATAFILALFEASHELDALLTIEYQFQAFVLFVLWVCASVLALGRWLGRRLLPGQLELLNLLPLVFLNQINN